MTKAIFALLNKEIIQRKWSIFTYSLLAFGFLWMYTAIYPSFARESAKFDELLNAYPKALLEAFNIEQLQLSTFAGYISAEHFSFVWPLMAILLMISTAGVSLAGEIEKGTMLLLLTLPIERGKLFISKYLAGLITLVIFVFFSALAIIPLAAVTRLDISYINVMKASFLSATFGWVIYSLSMLVSSWVKEKSKVYFIMGGLLMLMYVMNIVSGLITSLDKLKYLSFFYYFVPDKALVSGNINPSAIAVYTLVAVAASYCGYIIFRRRDVS